MDRRIAALLLAAALLAVAATSCGKPEPVPHDASVIGIVVGRTFLAGPEVRFDLDSGQSVTVGQNAVRILSGGTPDVGDLFLSGQRPEPWFVAFRPSDGRFEVRSQIDRSPDGMITFDFGLRLPMAAAYHSTGQGPMEADAPVLYVVNDRGEVVEGP
jgi:hypothetical protein